MNRRAPGEGKYAQLEREQRWTVLALPAAAERVTEIYEAEPAVPR